MNVSAEVFKWLQACSVAREGKKVQDNRIELAAQTSDLLRVGYLFGEVIRTACRNEPSYNDAIGNLQSLKQNHTPAIRLYNWNIVAEALRRLGLIVQPELKKEIVDGEASAVSELLKRFYERFVMKEAAKLLKPLQIDLQTVSAKKPLNESANILELTVVSLAKNLKLSPQHALNLFLQNNKYLAHLLVKGVKGSYLPIMEFLHDVHSQAQFIVLSLFCKEEKESVEFLFNVLKPGLISKDQPVAKRTLEIFVAFHEVYKQLYPQSRQEKLDEKILKEWLLADGINSFLYSIKRHEGLTEQLLSALLDYLEEQLYSHVTPTRNTLFTDNKELIGLFDSFLNVLQPPYTATFGESKQLVDWTKLLLKQLDSTDRDLKLWCAGILQRMWNLFPTYFHESDRQLPSTLINSLKALALENDTVGSSQALAMLFDLMLRLGLERNQYAPFLYKTLVSIFSFATQDEKVKFLVDNFIVNFRLLPNLPAGPLMTSLLTNIQNKASSASLELCKCMIDLNRLTVLETMQTVDILVKAIISDNVHSQFCLELLESALDTLDMDEELQQFILKSSKLGLSMLYAHEKTTRPVAHIQKQYDRNHDKMPKPLVEEAKLYHSIRNISRLLALFLNRYRELHQKLDMFLLHTYLQVKREFGKESKRLFDLLKQIHGDETQVQDSLKTIEVESEVGNDKNVAPADDQNKRVKSMMSSRLERSELNVSSMHAGGLRSPGDADSVTTPLDASMLRPTKRALKQLEHAKIKRDELRLKSEQQQERSRFESERTSKMVKGLLEQRSIQLGISNKKDNEVNCLFEWDSVKEDHADGLGLSSVRLVHIPAEQDSYVDAIDSFLKRYHKVWRFLFFKYSSSGMRNKEALAAFKAEQKINLAEVVKMVRDYQIENIKKEELQTLFRLINQKHGKHNDLLNLSYLGFEEFIVQFCLHLYNKPEEGYYHSPPVRHLKQFVYQLKETTKERHGSIQLFENPQNAYFQEGEVVKEFNRRLSENPKFILPEGYKKVKEVEVHFDYELSEAYDGFSYSYRTALEILSQIVFDKLGFNLIEPKTHKTETYRAKPVLFQSLIEKMKDYHQGYLRPKRASSTAERSPAKFKQVDKNEFHPLVRFSLGMKIGLGSVSVKDKYIAEEVAYWMDDMLDSVQNNEEIVHNKAHKVIDNEYSRRKKMQIEQKKKMLREFEQRYQKRDMGLKKNMISIKEEIDKKRQAEMEAARKIRQREQLRKKQKKQDYERIREIISKRKQEQHQTKQAKEAQQRARKQKIKQEYKKQVDEYFEKKRAEVKSLEGDLKKKREEEKQRKQQQERSIIEKQNKLYVNILRKDESLLNRVVDVKMVYSDVWQSASVQKILFKYDNQLKVVFDLLLKYEKSKISTTSYNEISNNTLNMFMVKFRIVPVLVTKNTVSQVYRSFLKQEAGEERRGVFGLDFPRFKEALFKICIKSKEVLNSMLEKNMESKQLERVMSKKAADGNHYEVGEVEESPSKESPTKKIERNPQLMTEYLFDPTDVKPATLETLLLFLQLPHDKLGIQQRFREALESKARPTTLLLKEMQSQDSFHN